MSMFEKDWILRQIKDMAKMVAVGVLHRSSTEYVIVDELALSEPDKLHLKLMELLKNGQIKEAQQVLKASMQGANLDYLKVAIDFYDRLCELSEEDRVKAGLSIGDIQKGLDDITKEYGIYL